MYEIPLVIWHIIAPVDSKHASTAAQKKWSQQSIALSKDNQMWKEFLCQKERITTAASNSSSCTISTTLLPPHLRLCLPITLVPILSSLRLCINICLKSAPLFSCLSNPQSHLFFSKCLPISRSIQTLNKPHIMFGLHVFHEGTSNIGDHI